MTGTAVFITGLASSLLEESDDDELSFFTCLIGVLTNTAGTGVFAIVFDAGFTSSSLLESSEELVSFFICLTGVLATTGVALVAGLTSSSLLESSDELLCFLIGVFVTTTGFETTGVETFTGCFTTGFSSSLELSESDDSFLTTFLTGVTATGIVLVTVFGAGFSSSDESESLELSFFVCLIGVFTIGAALGAGLTSSSLLVSSDELLFKVEKFLN